MAPPTVEAPGLPVEHDWEEFLQKKYAADEAAKNGMTTPTNDPEHVVTRGPCDANPPPPQPFPPFFLCVVTYVQLTVPFSLTRTRKSSATTRRRRARRSRRSTKRTTRCRFAPPLIKPLLTTCYRPSILSWPRRSSLPTSRRTAECLWASGRLWSTWYVLRRSRRFVLKYCIERTPWSTTATQTRR